MCYEHHISRRPCAGKAGLRVPFRSLLEPGRYPLTTLLCTPPTAVSKALRLPRLTAYYRSGIISADVRIMMLEVVMMSLARPGRRGVKRQLEGNLVRQGKSDKEINNHAIMPANLEKGWTATRAVEQGRMMSSVVFSKW